MSVTEGDSGTTNFDLHGHALERRHRRRSRSTTRPPTAPPPPPADYTATSGTLTFAPGELTKTITVPVVGDTTVEPDETFFVNLTGPRRTPRSPTTRAWARSSTTTWSDRRPDVTIDDVTVTEGNAGTTNFTFTVTLSRPPPARSRSTTRPPTAPPPPPGDYTATSGTLTFAQGELTKTITVPVVGDTTVEPDETFFVNLTGPRPTCRSPTARAWARSSTTT